MLRLFEILLRGIVLVGVALFRGVCYLINAAVAWTIRLNAKAQTMPNPRRYFWVRFGPAATCALILLAWPFIVASTTVRPTLVADSSASPHSVESGSAAGTTGAPGIPGPQFLSATPTPTVEPKANSAPSPTASPPIVDNSGGALVLVAGVVLPNSARTPGATNPAVTQATIGETICVSGWTATVRPSSSVTTALKIQQLATGYAYNGDTATRDYEEDHLISLELGGAPAAVANLWPEPYNVTEGARVKDRLENTLHALVCAGTISLAVAQSAIATNWWTAYQTYVGGVPAPAPVPVAPAPVAPAPVPVAPAPAPVSPSGGPTALCKDGTYSYAAHHQGACSHHGGVAVFYK